MFDEKNNIPYDNVEVTTEEDMLVLIYRQGDNPMFRTRIDKINRGKLLWAAWKMHRRANKWRSIPSQTTKGDGLTKETE